MADTASLPGHLRDALALLARSHRWGLERLGQPHGVLVGSSVDDGISRGEASDLEAAGLVRLTVGGEVALLTDAGLAAAADLQEDADG